MQHTLALRDARHLSYCWFGAAANRGGANARLPAAPAGNRTSGSPHQTIVYLHGFTSSRLEAELVHADALYHGQAVLAVDRPGYGCSSPHPEQTVESTAADVRELLDALELQQVAMMGVSGGSPFACACAALMPERVVALLLLSPLMPTLGREDQLLAGAGHASLRMCHGIQHRPWQVWATLHMLRLIQKVPHGNLLLKAGGFADVDRRAVDELPQEAAMLKAAVREGLAQGVAGAMRDLHVFHVAPPSVDLGAIRCKTVVWQGGQDTTTPPAMAQHYAATIPGAQLHMLADEGHLSLGFKHNREILGSIADEASHARSLM